MSTDLMFAIDDKVCPNGMIFGWDPHKDLVWPLGAMTREECSRIPYLPPRAPVRGIDVVAGNEGKAFLVERWGQGEFAILRLTRVVPATFQELQRGAKARVEFDWMLWKPR